MIFKAHQLRHVIYADRFTWVLHHPGVGRRVEVCLQRAIRRQIQRLSFVGSVWWQCYDMDSVLFCLHNTIQCNVTFIVIHSDDDRFFSARTCEPHYMVKQALSQSCLSSTPKHWLNLVLHAWEHRGNSCVEKCTQVVSGNATPAADIILHKVTSSPLSVDVT